MKIFGERDIELKKQLNIIHDFIEQENGFTVNNGGIDVKHKGENYRVKCYETSSLIVFDIFYGKTKK